MLQDIEGREKFEETVDTLGTHLHLPEQQIKTIKQAADASGLQDRLLEFKAKLKNGGNIRYELSLSNSLKVPFSDIRGYKGSKPFRVSVTT